MNETTWMFDLVQCCACNVCCHRQLLCASHLRAWLYCLASGWRNFAETSSIEYRKQFTNSARYTSVDHSAHRNLCMKIEDDIN